MDANHFRTAMGGHVHEVIRGQSIVHRHDDGAALRNGVELFEMLMCVRRDGRDAITLSDAQRREPCRPAVAALAKLRIRQPTLAVDDREAAAVELAGAAQEVQRSERRFHGPACRLFFPETVTVARA